MTQRFEKIRRIERLNRSSGPEVVEVNAQKVKDTVETLVFRVGQRGKTITDFKILVW